MTLRDRFSPADRATALLLAAGAFSAAFGYLWGLIGARFMAPAEYADFTAAASILYFVVIAAAPLSQSVAYFAASARDRNEALAIASSVERMVVVYGAAATLVLCIASPLIARAVHFRTPSALVAVFVASYLFALLSVRRGVVQGESRFMPLAANTFFEATFRLIAMFAVCFWLPRAYTGLATHAVTALIAMLLLPFPHTRARAPLGPVWRYLASAFGATAMYAAFLNTDVVLARIFFPAADAATYGAASFLGRASAMLVTPFYVFAVPHLVEARNDRDDLRRRFLRICAQYTALAAAGVIAMPSCGGSWSRSSSGPPTRTRRRCSSRSASPSRSAAWRSSPASCRWRSDRFAFCRGMRPRMLPRSSSYRCGTRRCFTSSTSSSPHSSSP